MKRRDYSEREQAEALAALDLNEGNISATARQTGFPASTIRLWRDNRDTGAMHSDLTVKCEEKKEELADLFEKVARSYIKQALANVSVENTKGKDAVMASAIATDKMQLLRGQPTAITSDVTNPAERAKKAVTILGEWKNRAEQQKAS